MFCDFSLSFVYYLRVFRGFMGLFRVLSSFLLFSVLYVLFKKRAGVSPRVFKPDKPPTAHFLNGFNISDINELILALIFRFGVKCSGFFMRYKDAH